MGDEITATIENIIEIGVRKAGSRAALCKAAGVDATTLWRLRTGRTKGKPWNRTIARLAAYALG